MYSRFREGICFEYKIKFKHKTNDFRDFLWFKKGKQKIKKLYYVNKIFTVLYIVLLAAVLLLSWFEFAKIVIICLFGCLSALLIPMSFYAQKHCTIKEYGQAFVLFKKRKQGVTYYSSIFDGVGNVAIPLFFMLFEIKLFL